MGNFKVQDHYFKKAKKENFLARSVYKLEEIDKKFKIIQAGNRVVDLGYHPGSWIQYTSQKVGAKGIVIGIDIKEINHKLLNIQNVKLYKKDVFDVETYSDLGSDLGSSSENNEFFDVVLSDMAPNTMGIKSVDQNRSLNLIEKVFEILPIILKPNGHLVAKVFDSHLAQIYLKSQKKLFDEFEFLKPKSTRSVSKEFFVIGKNYRHNT